MPVARRTILQGAFQNYDSLIAKNYIVPPQNNPRGDLDSNPVQTALCITIHSLVLQTKAIQRFVITEKAPTRAFSWLKAPTTAFTFKTL